MYRTPRFTPPSFNLATRLAIGVTVATLSAFTIAGPLMAQTPPRGVEIQDFDPRAEMQKEQQELKDKLHLTPAQESAWKTFAADMRPPGPPSGERGPGQRGPGRRGPGQPEQGAREQGPRDRGELAQLPLPERLDRMAERMDRRAAEAHKRVATVKAFYAVLNADQQKIFADNFQLRLGPPPGADDDFGGPGGPR